MNTTDILRASHLDGRVVVVTGAASGFGRLISRMSAARGAAVVGLDVDPAGLAETFEPVTSAGGRAIAIEADVCDAAAVTDAVQRGVDRFGAVDVLVNNAGVMPLAYFAEHRDAAAGWARCIDINVKGVVNGICAVHDHMVAQGGGHIVNISSIYGNFGVPGSGVYSATKAAVNVLSESLRIESQGRIKVTVVKPTGVPGTKLFSGVVNGDALLGLVAHKRDDYLAHEKAFAAGTMPPEQLDPDNVRYWSITAEELADKVLWVMDQPAGIDIAEITVRATGEDYVY